MDLGGLKNVYDFSTTIIAPLSHTSTRRIHKQTLSLAYTLQFISKAIYVWTFNVEINVTYRTLWTCNGVTTKRCWKKTCHNVNVEREHKNTHTNVRMLLCNMCTHRNWLMSLSFIHCKKCGWNGKARKIALHLDICIFNLNFFLTLF